MINVVLHTARLSPQMSLTTALISRPSTHHCFPAIFLSLQNYFCSYIVGSECALYIFFYMSNSNHTERLRRSPSGNWLIFIFSWPKPCTRIFYEPYRIISKFIYSKLLNGVITDGRRFKPLWSDCEIYLFFHQSFRFFFSFRFCSVLCQNIITIEWFRIELKTKGKRHHVIVSRGQNFWKCSFHIFF